MTDLFRLADLAVAVGGTSDRSVRLRLVFEFFGGAAEDGHPPRLLVTTEPASTRHERLDALLSAIVEDLCVHAGIRPPGWVHDDSRFLDRIWWVSDLLSARAEALVHAPASCRRRGVMIARRDLQATIEDHHPAG